MNKTKKKLKKIVADISKRSKVIFFKKKEKKCKF